MLDAVRSMRGSGDAAAEEQEVAGPVSSRDERGGAVRGVGLASSKRCERVDDSVQHGGWGGLTRVACRNTVFILLHRLNLYGVTYDLIGITLSLCERCWTVQFRPASLDVTGSYG